LKGREKGTRRKREIKHRVTESDKAEETSKTTKEERTCVGYGGCDQGRTRIGNAACCASPGITWGATVRPARCNSLAAARSHVAVDISFASSLRAVLKVGRWLSTDRLFWRRKYKYNWSKPTIFDRSESTCRKRSKHDSTDFGTFLPRYDGWDG
jgi:hypothetical protein